MCVGGGGGGWGCVCVWGGGGVSRVVGRVVCGAVGGGGLWVGLCVCVWGGGGLCVELWVGWGGGGEGRGQGIHIYNSEYVAREWCSVLT